jgi:putative nucleotidyltransferase with HDIG domain
MRVVSVSNLVPGLVVGRPVIDDSGQILLNRGVVLSAPYIRALESKGYEHIYVSETELEVIIEGDEDLKPATRARAVQSLRRVFDMIEHQVPNLRDMSFEDLRNVCASDTMRDLLKAGGPFDDIQGVAANILGEILTRSTLAGLTSIKSMDSQLYNHSVDVCVVALMIARAIGLDEPQLKQLATGCLLHDIGKMFVDRNESAVSQIRQHTLLGYELLKNSPNPDILAPHVALEHHEHQDGSGEPRGLVGSNSVERDRTLPPPIPTLVGEITAVANVYDVLLTGSADHPPMTPDAVVQAIRGAGGSHLNQGIVAAFVRLVPVYPLGTEVIVRSETYRNYTGIVCGINPGRLDKPNIILFKDNRGQTTSPIEVDMGEDPEFRIRCKF